MTATKKTSPPDPSTVPLTDVMSAKKPPVEGVLGFDLLIATADEVRAAKLSQGRTYVLGRGVDCDIVVDDPAISRRHARLTIGEEVLLEDLGSINGTRIAGEPLESGTGITLKIGTVVQLGSATLVVQRGRGQALPSTNLRTRRSAPPPPAEAPVDENARVVADPTMQNVFAMLDIVAPTNLSVLILGETGVGKEVFAHEVHRRSKRASAPFLQLNCAALPESLLEAELFGYEKGSFTGALKAKPGLFESAHGGTVFLDEVGDMPLPTQAKMLRFLESGEALRIGSVTSRKFDVRIVSATNRDLGRAMASTQFRSDLYFRLNGMMFTIPPLRERRADIAPLAKMFAALAAARLDRPAPKLTAATIDLLESHAWVGNVRELRNVVERAVVLSGTDQRELLPEHFRSDWFTVTTTSSKPSRRPPSFADIPEAETTRRMEIPSHHPNASSVPRPPPVPRSMPLPSAQEPSDLAAEVRDLEKQRIMAALAASGGNQSKAARTLGITRAVLLNRMKLFGLGRARKADDEEA